MTEVTTESVLGRRSDPTLRDLLAPLFRRKGTVIFIFSGILLGSIFVAYMVSSLHQGSMEILVESERMEPLISPTKQGGDEWQVTDSLINTEIELLKSPDLLREVVLANHLDNAEHKSLTSRILGKQPNDWYIARAVQHLGSQLNIKGVGKTSLIQITYNAVDPKLAVKVLQTLGNRYLEKHLVVHRAPGSYAFFSSQAQKYQQALQEAEARLGDFSKKSGDAAPELEKSAMAQHVIDSIAALHETQQHLAADQKRIQDEEARLKVTPDRALASQATDSAQGLLQGLQSTLLEKQFKRTQLALKFDPSYPLVQEADQEIAQTKGALTQAEKLQYVNQTTERDSVYELIRADIARTRADLASHQAAATALENSIHSLKMQIVELDQRSLKQADLVREVKTNEANYLLYVSKREQERTSDALDEKRISNVSIAVPPVLPILPFLSPALVVAIGIVLALFISAALTFVLEYLNPSLRTPDEVVDVLRIPVLASVPKQTA